MRWPFGKSRPHRRWRTACPGTGRMPILADRGDGVHTALCAVCGALAIRRKHPNLKHGWAKGSLVFHCCEPVKLAWWERFLEWRLW